MNQRIHMSGKARAISVAAPFLRAFEIQLLTLALIVLALLGAAGPHVI